MMKICRQCGIEKPLDDYYVHSKMADGHLNKCKECVKTRVGKHREENIEEIRAYDRKRGRTENRKEKCREYSRSIPNEKRLESNRKYKEKYPEKYHARNVLYAATRDGRLVKPLECERCKEVKKLHGHHHDYSKPLDVEWLCNDCHAKEHRKYD